MDIKDKLNCQGREGMSRRSFLAVGLGGLVGGLAGLVLGSDSYASEDKKVPERIPYKKDPFISLREKYAYKDLKKALGEVYEKMDKRDRKELEINWEYGTSGVKGLIYEYYLKGIYENPEKFKKFIPEKMKKDLLKISLEQFNLSLEQLNEREIEEFRALEIKEMRDLYPWLNEKDFKPNEQPVKIKEINQVLMWVTNTLLNLSRPLDFPPHTFKKRSLK